MTDRERLARFQELWEARHALLMRVFEWGLIASSTGDEEAIDEAEAAREHLQEWNRANAHEYNRLKPWYEARASTEEV